MGSGLNHAVSVPLQEGKCRMIADAKIAQLRRTVKSFLQAETIRASTRPLNMIVPVPCNVLSSFPAEPAELGPIGQARLRKRRFDTFESEWPRVSRGRRSRNASALGST
jgi:hypothetical protein